MSAEEDQKRRDFATLSDEADAPEVGETHTELINEPAEPELEAEDAGKNASSQSAMTKAANRRRFLALATVLTSAFGINLTLTVLTVAMPKISDDFDESAEATAWVTIAPMIVAALCVPAFGRASDMFGHRSMWLIGLAIISVSLVISAFSPNLPILVFSRVIAGIGGGAVFPSSLSLISSMYAENERSGPFGAWTSATAISPMIGVVAGGMIIEVMSWRWLFHLQLPFSVGSFVCGLIFIDNPPTPDTSRQFDLWGLITLALSTGSLLLGVNQGSLLGWGSPVLIVCYIVFPLSVAAFLYVEKRCPNPIVPLNLFSNPIVLNTLLSRFWINFVYLGSFIIMPFFMDELQGLSPGQISMRLLARPFAMALASPFVGVLSKYFYEGNIMTASAFSICLSSIVFVVMNKDTPYIIFLLGLIPAGAGLGISSTISTTMVTKRIPKNYLGAGSGLLTLVNSVANSLGMAVMMSILTIFGGVENENAYRMSFAFALLVSIAAVVNSHIATTHARREDKQQQEIAMTPLSSA